jgi:hypothetical protein
MRKVLMIGAALCALGLMMAPAQAAVFNFNYVGMTDTSVSGHGQFTGTEEGITPIYDVTSITGTTNDGAIITGSPSSYASADNKLYYPAAISGLNDGGYETYPTFVDVYGISFNVVGGDTWNIGNYGGTAVADMLTNSGGYTNGVITPVELTVSAVPEIGTWAMMLAGFGALGFAGYRRSKREPAALAA